MPTFHLTFVIYVAYVTMFSFPSVKAPAEVKFWSEDAALKDQDTEDLILD